ncbi:MAG: hypothetical protein HY329_12210 [Chloroflexi bacterium]|nr:hypothetical protein [Chloroflexota bacterium]
MRAIGCGIAGLWLLALALRLNGDPDTALGVAYLGLIPVIVVGLLIGSQVPTLRVALRAGSTPVDLTVDDLLTNRPPLPRYVRLTGELRGDLALRGTYAVQVRSGKSSVTETRTYCRAPLVGSGWQPGAPAPVVTSTCQPEPSQVVGRGSSAWVRVEGLLYPFTPAPGDLKAPNEEPTLDGNVDYRRAGFYFDPGTALFLDTSASPATLVVPASFIGLTLLGLAGLVYYVGRREPDHSRTGWAAPAPSGRPPRRRRRDRAGPRSELTPEVPATVAGVSGADLPVADEPELLPERVPSRRLAAALADPDAVELLDLSTWNDGHTAPDVVAYLPDEIGRLSRLRSLWLAGNALTTLPDAIGRLESLEELDLRFNAFGARLPEALGGLRSLRSLDLERSKLTRLPETIGRLASLVDFRAPDNALTELPDSIGDLTSLETLCLHSNWLRVLPAAIGRLQRLRILDLERNYLVVLPPELGDLGGLRELDLSGNELREIPPELGALVSLETLRLDGNALRALPGSVVGLTALRTLGLSGNPLASLPDEIAKLRRLEALTLTLGAGVHLPAGIQQLGALRSLVLVAHELPLAVTRLTSLHRLDLSVRLDARAPLPPELGDLSNLRRLKLGLKSAAQIPDTVAKLTRLEALAVHCQKLTPAQEERLRRLLPWAQIAFRRF